MATEKIGTLSNRVFSNLLDRSFKNGSISGYGPFLFCPWDIAKPTFMNSHDWRNPV